MMLIRDRILKGGEEDSASSSEDEKEEEEEEEETKENDMEESEEEDGEEEEEELIPETPVDVPAQLTFLPVEESIQSKSITDFRQFKDSLPMYPVSKLT